MARHRLTPVLLVLPLLCCSGFAQEHTSTQLRHAHELDTQVSALCGAGKYAEALPLALDALQRKERLSGPDDPDTGTSLSNLALCYMGLKQYAEAEPRLRRVLEIWDAKLEPNHPSRPLALSNLGVLYLRLERWAEAEPLLKRALQIREQIIGPDDPRTLGSVRNLAVLYLRTRRYGEAGPLLERIVQTRERDLGRYDAQTLAAVKDLAEFYVLAGREADAAPLRRRLEEARERAAGQPGDPAEDRPWRLEQVRQWDREAAALLEAGKYEQALQAATQALNEKTALLGPDDPDTGRSAGTLGQCYEAVGRYADAEAALTKALAIAEKQPEADPARPEALSSLGTLLQRLGRDQEAAPLFRRALSIREQTLPPADPRIATSLLDVAGVEMRLGRFSEAQPLLDRALDISGNILGPLHPQTAICYTGMAVMYAGLRNWDGGEGYLTRALAINERAFGPDHPVTAATLQDLGSLYCLLGRPHDAEPLLLRALSIRGQTLGPSHLATAETLDTLGDLCAATGRAREALAYLQRGAVSHDASARQVFAFSSPRHRADFARLLAGATDAFLTLCVEQLADAPEARRAGLQLILDRKAWLLNSELAQIRAQHLLAGAPADPLLQELRSVRERLAKLVYAVPASGEEEASRRQWATLLERQENLEADLARQSPEFGQQLALSRASLDAVRQALPADSALVELMVYRPYRYTTGGGEGLWGDPRYVAFVLRSGDGAPACLPLGSAADIDAAARRFRRAIAADATEADITSAGRALHGLVWEPLAARLGEATRIIISPDGQLALTSFAALRGPDGKYLCERYVLQVANSGRDLTAPAAPDGAGALIVANPDFGRRPGAAVPATPPARPGQAAMLAPLPGTEAEARAVAGLLARSGLTPQLLLHGEATEEALKQAHAPRWLHIATHGLYLPAPRGGQPAAEPAVAATGWGMVVRGTRLALPGMRADAPLPPLLADPMHRSVLALAGARLALQGTPAPEGVNDGLLTAEEVAGLDLRGTRLAVLSACDTGLGEVRVGEGVMGLRRAFATAGVGALVMSLWNVPDVATRDLMADFYRAILTHGDTAAALAAAQRSALARQRASGHVNPWAWGAFGACAVPGR